MDWADRRYRSLVERYLSGQRLTEGELTELEDTGFFDDGPAEPVSPDGYGS